MEINEVLKSKKDLEHAIKQLIMAYNSDTNTRVSSINLTYCELMNKYTQEDASILHSVIARVEL